MFLAIAKAFFHLHERISSQISIILAVSVLTATTFTYTHRAGITAAAGTRLALDQFLFNVFKLFSSHTLFQNGHNCVTFRRYFVELTLNNFRACCLPQKWERYLRLPLRNQTLIFRYPLITLQSKILKTYLMDQYEVLTFEMVANQIDMFIYNSSNCEKLCKGLSL